MSFEIEQVTDINEDGATDIDDVKLFFEQNPHKSKALAQGGDFRSDESIELLKQSDIVVSNPPFSLFREYVAQLVEHKKRFLILGNQSAIVYKEIFPLIRDNKVWLGVDNGGTKWFQVKDHYDIKTESRKKVVDGIKYFSMGTIMWFTNLDHGRRHQNLQCMTTEENLRFSKHNEIRGKESYDRYENYEAIDVPFTDAIPSDYDGIMGVPVTFLDKYNPEQFEIVGSNRGVDQDPQGVFGRGSYLSGKETFKRLFIRHRHPKGVKK